MVKNYDIALRKASLPALRHHLIQIHTDQYHAQRAVSPKRGVIEFPAIEQFLAIPPFQPHRLRSGRAFLHEKPDFLLLLLCQVVVQASRRILASLQVCYNNGNCVICHQRSGNQAVIQIIYQCVAVLPLLVYRPQRLLHCFVIHDIESDVFNKMKRVFYIRKGGFKYIRSLRLHILAVDAL